MFGGGKKNNKVCLHKNSALHSLFAHPRKMSRFHFHTVRSVFHHLNALGTVPHISIIKSIVSLLGVEEPHHTGTALQLYNLVCWGMHFQNKLN